MTLYKNLFELFDVSSGETPMTHIHALNKEIAFFGYTLSIDVMEKLNNISISDFNQKRQELVEELADKSGSTVDYTRLFNNFPYDTPDHEKYLNDRLVAVLFDQHLKEHDAIPNSVQILSCGHFIPRFLFKSEDFGACPLCQYQIPELSSGDGEKYELASDLTPLTIIKLMTKETKTELANSMMARGSSLSSDEKDFLMKCIHEGISLKEPETIFKENIPFAYTILGDSISKHISGASDTLRIIAYLSDTKNDLSLGDKFKVKLRTSQKKKMLSLLENTKNLKEDLLRHRDMWLRFADHVAAGSEKVKEKYPNVYSAFDALRNNKKSIWSYNKEVELIIKGPEKMSITQLNMIATRPTEFVRRLDKIISRAENVQDVITVFETIVDTVPEMTLLSLNKYFQSRDDQSFRVFSPKGNSNKLHVVENNREPISDDLKTSLANIMNASIIKRFTDRTAMGSVYIDEGLSDIIMPSNQRGESSSSQIMIPKGSRVSFDGDIVRSFLYWKNPEEQGYSRVDVDLSCNFYDKNFQELDQISYTKIKTDGAVHSGDIQDAPNGASEFVDLDINRLLKRGIRYATVSVIVYSGLSFKNFECFTGIMERDSLTSGAVYEPSTVKQKIDISSDNRSYIPVLLDLKNKTMIYADISSGNNLGQNAQKNIKNAAITESILSMADRKPTVYDIIKLNVSSRGNEVSSKENADIVFEYSDIEDMLTYGVEEYIEKKIIDKETILS